jgi:hypothetical protein
MELIKRGCLLASAAAAFLASAGASKAAVTFTFTQVGNNVVATTSGSMQTPTSSPTTPNLGFSTQSTFSNQVLRWIATSFSYYLSAGSISSTGITVGADSSSGDAFGYQNATLYTPTIGAPGLTTFTPDTTLVWTSRTISEIFSGNVPVVPRQVFTGNYGTDNNIFLVAVPEPGVTLLSLAALPLLFGRRRR